MVNPDRLHNAAAALDILARADSTAFATGRSDATESSWDEELKLRQRISALAKTHPADRDILNQMLLSLGNGRAASVRRSLDAMFGRSDAAGSDASVLAEIEKEGQYDARKNLTPFCPYKGAERDAYIRGWKSAGGFAFRINDSTHGNTAPSYAEIQRKLARGENITPEEQQVVNRMVGSTSRRSDAAGDAKYYCSYEWRGEHMSPNSPNARHVGGPMSFEDVAATYNAAVKKPLAKSSWRWWAKGFQDVKDGKPVRQD